MSSSPFACTPTPTPIPLDQRPFVLSGAKDPTRNGRSMSRDLGSTMPGWWAGAKIPRYRSATTSPHGRGMTGWRFGAWRLMGALSLMRSAHVAGSYRHAAALHGPDLYPGRPACRYAHAVPCVVASSCEMTILYLGSIRCVVPCRYALPRHRAAIPLSGHSGDNARTCRAHQEVTIQR